MADSATTTRQKPAEKRYAAISAITGPACNDEHEFILVFTPTQLRKTAEKIRATLLPLGRTDRWKYAVDGWAQLIEQAATPEGFRWAFFQGGIYAANAAE